ncbi:hypothetical protein NEUTE1DRAFT_116721, partial [Neurospora tetrasperma FGSC 2508]
MDKVVVVSSSVDVMMGRGSSGCAVEVTPDRPQRYYCRWGGSGYCTPQVIGVAGHLSGSSSRASETGIGDKMIRLSITQLSEGNGL